MTIIGIAGCSALLVAGFGINDSISDIVNQQYNVIYHYDATVSAKTSEITSQIKSLKGVKDVYEEDHLAVTTKIENKDISTTVHIISNDKKFKDLHVIYIEKRHKSEERCRYIYNKWMNYNKTLFCKDLFTIQ